MSGGMVMFGGGWDAGILHTQQSIVSKLEFTVCYLVDSLLV